MQLVRSTKVAQDLSASKSMSLQTFQPLSKLPAQTPLLAASVLLTKGYPKGPGKSMCIQRHNVRVSGKRLMASVPNDYPRGSSKGKFLTTAQKLSKSG